MPHGGIFSHTPADYDQVEYDNPAFGVDEQEGVPVEAKYDTPVDAKEDHDTDANSFDNSDDDIYDEVDDDYDDVHHYEELH